jgi:hypothetical protein
MSHTQYSVSKHIPLQNIQSAKKSQHELFSQQGIVKQKISNQRNIQVQNVRSIRTFQHPIVEIGRAEVPNCIFCPEGCRLDDAGRPLAEPALPHRAEGCPRFGRGPESPSEQPAALRPTRRTYNVSDGMLEMPEM